MIGMAIRDERRRRRWSLADVAQRARVSLATVAGVEAGRRASMETYARLVVALGLSLDITVTGRQRRAAADPSDIVHAAMGEYEAEKLARAGHHVELDWPYQHCQFVGRADVVAWTRDLAALLHIENRTRSPDLHTVRLRPATFRALCPDTDERVTAWLLGTPPTTGRSSSFVLLDPLARDRQAATAGLERLLGGTKPRARDHRDAAERLRAAARLRGAGHG